MNAAITTPRVSARDRLAFTLFLSLALNFVVIVGITFDLNDIIKQEDSPPTLDVILVEKNDSEAAEEAEFLAQMAQSGAGNTSKKTRPTTMQAAPALPVPVDGDSDIFQPEQTMTEIAPTQQEVLTSFEAQQKILSLDSPEQNPADRQTTAEMMRRGQEIARLSAEIKESAEIYSKRTKHRYISANSKAFRDATYHDAWRRKVERIGNLNYPEEAKRRNLSGTLVLDVAINPNGTISSTTILTSSNNKLLDDAAIRIVRLAAPYAPLSPAMLKDTDVLHITKAWLFLPSNRLSTK